MARKQLTRKTIGTRTIDIHTHSGISLSAFLSGGYPYCMSIEALLRAMDDNRIDFAVSFPMGETVFYDVGHYLEKKKRIPSTPRLSHAPFAAENRLLCEEVYEKVPGAAERVMPFATMDPSRHVREQIKALEKLSAAYPIYGLKVCGVLIQSSHRELLRKGRALVDFARERNLPILMHSTAYPGDKFSHTSINLEVVRARPDIRFCLAHCVGFDKVHLDEIDSLPNVWVDTAAMKIQVEPEEILAPVDRRFPSDYKDYCRVFCDLARTYPDTLIWGSDAPAYSYIEKRKYADGSTVIFRLHGTYEMEAAALNSLKPAQRLRACNVNSLKFLFG